MADNLQLVADLGYGDVALAAVSEDGDLRVVADARPSTAIDPFAMTRTDARLEREVEPEAYATLTAAQRVDYLRPRVVNDVVYRGEAHPIGVPQPYAVVLRVVSEQIEEAAGRMERVFIASALDLLETLAKGPLRDARTGGLFATTRRAGDGVLRVDAGGRVAYASPNAVTILRLAGVEGRVTDMRAAELPGGGAGVMPVLGTAGAIATQIEVAERVLGYRSMTLGRETLVLVEDLTEARRREREIGAKEATLREVHHRVKNNLQTIVALFRIQARRSDDAEVHRALAEATERVAAMASVHDLLARSEDESVDFDDAARRVVELVRSGLFGDERRIALTVVGGTGRIDGRIAMPLALALAELVHNALEHAFAPEDTGAVTVRLRRDSGRLVLVVEDDGRGLPPGFDLAADAGLGFAIVRTLVEEDLRGTLTLARDRGVSVTVAVPLTHLAEDNGATTPAQTPAEGGETCES